MSAHDREWPALVKEILRTAEFHRAPLRAELLRYLFANIHKSHGISRKTLAAEVFKSARYDEGAVGERCLDLRNALREYAESGAGQVQTWRCELPPAVPSEGYRLRFVNRVAAPGATGSFWQAHLSPPRDVLIIYNEPLFYRDEEENTVIRYLDINHDQTQTDRELALNELKAKRPNAHKKKLHPSYLYLLSGEVAARDCIEHWFDAVAGVRAEGRIGRRVTSPEIGRSSPVLLGNLRTNSFMRNILESASCEHLDYRLDQEGFGTVTIRNPGEQERKVLPKQDGDRGRTAGQGSSLLLTGAPEANRDVFGVVTRIPNPYDNEGAVTIISSDHTRAVEQIAHMLTDEHRLSVAIAQAGWAADELPPACFQCLFAVRLGPVNMDTEAKPAVLLSTRSYQT
jgi:hypothetical protein